MLNLIRGIPLSDSFGTIEKNGFRDKLERFRDRFVRIPEECWDENAGWLQSAEAITDSGKVNSIIADHNPRKRDFILLAGKLDPDGERYQATTNCRVRKTPEALFEKVQAFVRYAKRIDIVDPYFETAGWTTSSFIRFAELIMWEMRDKPHFSGRLTFHTKKPPTYLPNVQKNNLTRLLSPTLLPGEVIAVKFWELNPARDRNHDRHLITDLGLMTSTYGWGEDDQGSRTTDISFKNSTTHHQLYRCFCTGETDEFGILTPDATIEVSANHGGQPPPEHSE